jgi:hypothetical protein
VLAKYASSYGIIILSEAVITIKINDRNYLANVERAAPCFPRIVRGDDDHPSHS